MEDGRILLMRQVRPRCLGAGIGGRRRDVVMSFNGDVDRERRSGEENCKARLMRREIEGLNPRVQDRKVRVPISVAASDAAHRVQAFACSSGVDPPARSFTSARLMSTERQILNGTDETVSDAFWPVSWSPDEAFCPNSVVLGIFEGQEPRWTPRQKIPRTVVDTCTLGCILIDSISTPPAALRATALATLGMRGGWDGRLEAERAKGTRGDEARVPQTLPPSLLTHFLAHCAWQGGSVSARAIRGARLPQPLTLGRDDKQQQARYRLRSDVRARAAPSQSIIKYGHEGIMYPTIASVHWARATMFSRDPADLTDLSTSESFSVGVKAGRSSIVEQKKKQQPTFGIELIVAKYWRHHYLFNIPPISGQYALYWWNIGRRVFASNSGGYRKYHEVRRMLANPNATPSRCKLETEHRWGKILDLNTDRRVRT
ncbi:hypothetical protein C8F04DRAFT_1193109 [Mycena alexandri]|uniref:Uncharacterized protein n=1 Tax=Mycena alexandri TaxID=1745969 RepID=A0AAD6SEB4_9AGAR|nr:hypothetical protein C8F04DRAFT_1193109 [Mycena alexandri]